MTTGTTTARTGRAELSFQDLQQKYPHASLAEASGLLHAMMRAWASVDDDECLFNFLIKEAEHAPEQELQTVAMKFIARKYINTITLSFHDERSWQRIQVCLDLLAQTNWQGRLMVRDWKNIQEFVAKRFDEEAQRRRFDDDSPSLPPLFDPATLDQALINTCNWTLLIGKRWYRVIPNLYNLVLRHAAGCVSPAEYQSGRYLPESGLFRGDYHLRAFNMMKLANSLEASELARIGRDVLRMVVLCGDAKLERGLQEPEVGQASTLLALVATALDERDIRLKIETVLPVCQA